MAGEKLVRIDITDLASDGKSVGHLEGKVVFCNGGLPGEQVLAEIVRNKPRYSIASVHEITRKSEARIDPVCEHFSHCGGCAWQDLEYSQQLEYKRMQVAACLERLAKLHNVELTDVVGAPDQYFYRNKMEFSFHVTDNGVFALGLHRQGHFDQIFDLNKCHLESETSNRLVRWMRDFVRKHGIPVYDVKNHVGYMRFLVIREGKRTGQVLVNLVTNYGDMPHQDELIQGIREEAPMVTTIVHNQNGQRSNTATGEIEAILFGPGYIEEEVSGRRFRVTANSFFQTNTVQAERLYQIGFDMLGLQPADRVLDLYSGTGTIAILAADYAGEVVGVELVPDAVRIAKQNLSINGLSNVSFYGGNVRDVLRSEDLRAKPFTVLVVDPPRAGLHPKALKRILEITPPRLLYISCNPATFARDAALITDVGYVLPRLVPVDMFPHTKHIEVVGLFLRT